MTDWRFGIDGDGAGDDDLDVQSWDLTLLVAKLVAVVLLAGTIWFFRPWFHGLFYAIRYSPAALIAVGIPLLIGLALVLVPPLSADREESIERKGTLFVSALILFVAVGVVYGTGAGMVEQRTMADQTMSTADLLEEPPEVNEENPRIAPRAVSDVQTDGAVSYAQHDIGESDIARTENGTLAWSYPIQPDQLRNQLTNTQRGLIHSDMTAMEDRDLEAYDDHEFTYGQNMRLWDNAEWQLKKGGYWSQYYDDPYEFVYEGEAYMAFPKTGHEWHFSPIPHTTPTWDGVALVHQDGTIEHLSPEEAQERPELEGQRLYPLYNSKQFTESLEYREGIVNQLEVVGEFENVVEPAEMPSGVGNDQPFVIDMADERMNYVYAMEPAGGGAGLSEVWFFDGETGEPRYFETGEETVFGPDRAVGVARGTDTQTEWGEDGEAMAVEPILLPVDDSLYWHIKVVTADQTDVVRNIFVDAQGDGEDDAVVMDSSAEVEEFIAGDIDEADLEDAEDAEIDIDEEAAEDEEDVAYYVVITDDEGTEIDRIAVEEGQEATIEPEG